MSDINSDSPARFAGFISYSQKDKVWAKRIHKALETYRLPIGFPQTDALPGRKLGRFFRDDDELSGAESLGDSLDSAIDQSKALIVICSPNSAKSKWVDAEIRRFKRRGNNAKVFAIIVDGKPDPDDPDDQCFPPSLMVEITPNGDLTNIPAEPLAPDASKDKFSRLITRVVAGLLGLEFDTLWQREKRRILKRRIYSGVAALMLISISLFGLNSVNTATQEKQKAERAQYIEKSLRLTKDAQTAMDENRWDDALQNAVNALPADLDKPNKPVVDEALVALKRLMTGNASRGVVAKYEMPIEFIFYLDSDKVGVMLETGRIDIFDATTNELEKTFSIDSTAKRIGQSNLARMVFNDTAIDENKQEFWQQSVTVYDLSDGSEKYRKDHKREKWDFTNEFSANGKLILARPTFSAGRFNQLAVFDLSDTGDDAAPIYTVDLPFDYNSAGTMRAAFRDEESAIISGKTRDDKKPILVLWNFVDGTIVRLAPDKSNSCATPTDFTPVKDDGISLSPDVRYASYYWQIAKRDWCIQRWDLMTGKVFDPAVMSDIYTDSLLPLRFQLLSSGLVLTTGSSDAIFSTETLENSTAHKLTRIGDCDSDLYNYQSLVPNQLQWILKLNPSISICSHGNNITIHQGNKFAYNTTLLGHNEEVVALAVDTKNARIWSAAKDNSLRKWVIEPLQTKIEADGAAFLSKAGAKRVLAYYDSPADNTYRFQLYNADGEKTGPNIKANKFRRQIDDQWQTAKVSFELLNEGDTLAIAESFHCKIPLCFLEKQEDCCPVPREFRLTLINTKTGEVLSTIEDANFPNAVFSRKEIEIIEAHDKPHALVRTQENVGVVIDLNTGKVLQTLVGPKDGYMFAPAYADGTWWFLSQKQETLLPDEYKTGEIKVLRETKPGELAAILTTKGDSGKLITSDDGMVLYLEITKTLEYENPFRSMAYTAQSGLIDIEIPKSTQQISGIETVIFANGTDEKTRKLFLFPEDYSSSFGPPYIADTAGGQAVLAAGPSMPSSYSDRLKDPLVRGLVNATDGRLRLRPFDDKAPFCPNLDRIPTEGELEFSPNGRYLKLEVSKNSKKITQVYDLKICQMAYSSPAHDYDDSAFFVANDKLWVQVFGTFRFVDLNSNASELLKAAQTIAQVE